MPKKLKGKEWYTLIAPKLFKEKIIGETLASEAKNLIGRTMQVNLMKLTEDFSKYYIKLKLKVVDVKEKNAYTEFSGWECMRDYISRFIRYGVKRIDTIQDLFTKDEKKIRVKTIIITSKKIKRNVSESLKSFVEDRFKKEVSSSTLEEFVQKLVDDSLKRSVMEEGKKIYPIRAFEVRKVETL